jgi:nucleoside-diphosphate-sugar epimerase
MHLLICGNGYLGGAVKTQAVKRNWKVDTCSLSGDHDNHACDLGDEESVRNLVSIVGRPDAVVHCASSGKGGAEAYQHVYRNGIANLARYFPESLLLFTSSSSVYNQTDGSIVTEISPALPERETGSILLEAERLTLAAAGIVCRLSGIYGPGRSVILKKFLSGEAVIEEGGDRYLNQIHRDDAATAMIMLMELAWENTPHPIRGGIFNLSDSQSLTQRELYQHFADSFQRPLPPQGPRDLQRKRGWTHKQVSNRKMCEIGWQPSYPCYLDALSELCSIL